MTGISCPNTAAANVVIAAMQLMSAPTQVPDMLCRRRSLP